MSKLTKIIRQGKKKLTQIGLKNGKIQKYFEFVAISERTFWREKIPVSFFFMQIFSFPLKVLETFSSPPFSSSPYHSPKFKFFRYAFDFLPWEFS